MNDNNNNNESSWLENVMPEVEIINIEEQPSDEVVDQSIKEISLSEAEYRSLMQKGKLIKEKDRNVLDIDHEEKRMESLGDTSDYIGNSLIKLVADIDSSAFQNDDTSENRQGMDKKIIDRLAKVGLLAQKQGTYLLNVSRKFAKELDNLIINYRVEKSNIIERLAVEKLNHSKLKEEYHSGLKKIEQLELTIKDTEKENNKLEEKLQNSFEKNEKINNNSEEKSQSLLTQISKLEGIIKIEQELRRQAESREKDLRKYADLRIKEVIAQHENEKKHRTIAESKYQKAMQSAKEVINYFVNTSFMWSNNDGNHNNSSISDFLTHNFSTFDGLMLNKKSAM